MRAFAVGTRYSTWLFGVIITARCYADARYCHAKTSVYLHVCDAEILWSYTCSLVSVSLEKIARVVRLGSSLSVIYMVQGEHPHISDGIGVGYGKVAVQRTKAVIYLKRGKIESKLLGLWPSMTSKRDTKFFVVALVANLREIRLVIYRILSLRPCQLPLKASNETHNCLHTLCQWKITASSHGFPATARLFSYYYYCYRLKILRFYRFHLRRLSSVLIRNNVNRKSRRSSTDICFAKLLTETLQFWIIIRRIIGI